MNIFISYLCISNSLDPNALLFTRTTLKSFGGKLETPITLAKVSGVTSGSILRSNDVT